MCQKAKIGSFVAGKDGLGDKVFDEFNTLAVVYDQPGDQFTDADYQWVVTQAENTGSSSPNTPSRPQPEAGNSGGSADLLGFGGSAPSTPAPAPAPAGGLDDFFGGGSPAPAPAPAPAPSGGMGLDDFFGGGSGGGSNAAPTEIQLEGSPSLDQPTFQKLWKNNAMSGKVAVAVGAANVPKIKSGLARAGIAALALKDMGKAYKLFMHAAESSPTQGARHLLMVMVEKATGKFIAQVKSVNGGSFPLFETKLKAALSSL